METVMVGERGQITLPKRYRDKMGIKPKSPVLLELTEQGIVVKPALTISLRTFSDEFIRELEKEDSLKPGEKEKALSRWKKS
jgi:AbrB family looped-hinge helix DNA binding protein